MGPDLFLKTREFGYLLDDLPDSRGGESAAMLTEENFASRLGLH